jgi:hypothetical protein
MRSKIFQLPSHIAICLLMVMLSACASGARTGAMTAEVTPDNIIADSSPVKGAIKVGTVAGGEATNPLWKSEVSNENFRTALEQSLALHTMAASKSPGYMLNAELVDLDQPFGGFDMTVTAKVHYTLVRSADGAVAVDELISTPFTATMGDSMLGVERMRLANEGAVRANITTAIAKIIASVKPVQPLAS